LKRILSVLLLALILLGASFGCENKNENTLYAYVGGGVDSLDPIRAETKAAQTYIANLYSGLYSYSYDEGGLPVLVCEDAEGLPKVKELDDGKLELTFTLKEGLTWSRGIGENDDEPVTPEDYVYSWNRAAGYFLGSDKSYIFTLIDGYESFVNYDEDAKLNMSYDNRARTFTVVVKEDSEKFLSYTTETALFPVSRVAVRDSDDWDVSASDFRSNGRYKLEKLDSGRLVVVKNENHRDSENTRADRIEFLFDINEAEVLYEKNQLTFAKFTEDTSMMLGRKSGTVCASGYVAFNADDPALGLFSEEEKTLIRKAVAIYITEADAFGEEDAFLVPSLGKRDTFSSLTEADADALLEQVALSSERFVYQDGKVYEFPILTAISAGRDGEQKKWSAVASALSEQGINLRIINCSWEEFLSSRTAGDYSMLFNSWSYSTLSPGELLSLFRSDSIYNDTMAGAKKDGLSWEEYDSTVTVRISDAEKANEYYAKALLILEETALVIPVLNARTEYFTADEKEYRLSCDGIVRFG